MKRLTALLLSLVMIFGLTACGESKTDTTGAQTETQGGGTASANTLPGETLPGSTAPDTESEGPREVELWCPEGMLGYFEERSEAFFSLHPEYADIQLKIDEHSPEEAAETMCELGASDAVERVLNAANAPSIFAYSSEKTEKLQAVGILSPRPEETEGTKPAHVLFRNRAPLLLYYDKSAVSHTEQIDDILTDCAAAGKSLYMNVEEDQDMILNFWAAAGLNYRISYGPDGSPSDISCDYYTPLGKAVLRYWMGLKTKAGFFWSSESTEQLLGAHDGSIGAFIAAADEAEAFEFYFGENFGVTLLPSFQPDYREALPEESTQAAPDSAAESTDTKVPAAAEAMADISETKEESDAPEDLTEAEESDASEALTEAEENGTETAENETEESEAGADETAAETDEEETTEEETEEEAAREAVSFRLTELGSSTCLGVNALLSEERRSFCHELAAFICSAESQQLLYEIEGILPEKPEAWQGSALSESILAEAMTRVSASCLPAPEHSTHFAEAYEPFRDKLLADGFAEYSDARLQQHLDELCAFLMADY